MRILAVNNTLGNRLNDSGLADTRIADQNRIALGTPCQCLNDLQDLLAPPNHRRKHPVSCHLGEIAAEPFKNRTRCTLVVFRWLIGFGFLGWRRSDSRLLQTGDGQGLDLLAIMTNFGKQTGRAGVLLREDGNKQRSRMRMGHTELRRNLLRRRQHGACPFRAMNNRTGSMFVGSGAQKCAHTAAQLHGVDPCGFA